MNGRREGQTTGTVIVFDELINFPEFRRHEFLALYELLQKHPHRFEWFGCPCGMGTEMGLPAAAIEGDGTCLATAMRILPD